MNQAQRTIPIALRFIMAYPLVGLYIMIIHKRYLRCAAAPALEGRLFAYFLVV